MPRTRTDMHSVSTELHKDRVVLGLVIAYIAGLGMYGIMGIMVDPPALDSRFEYSESAAAERLVVPRVRAVPTSTTGELVQNGSFEEPIVRAGSQFLTTVNGWVITWTNDRPRQMSLTRQPGVEVLAGYQGWKALEGSQYVRMDSADLGGRAAATQSLVSLSQMVSTQVDTEYTLTVYVAAQPKTAKAENQLLVQWNKQDVGLISLDGSKAAAPQWKKYSFTVTGTGADELQLVGQGPENRAGMLVDQVSVLPLVPVR
ncbi:MAG: hypothetical protein KBD66_04390 [Candidatus Doudnabacteria bacterium]|nr:hypothetical protein [Candidatus Doudnabacteria bacterium]